MALSTSSLDSSAWGMEADRPLYWPSFTSGYSSARAAKVKPSGPMSTIRSSGAPATRISSRPKASTRARGNVAFTAS